MDITNIPQTLIKGLEQKNTEQLVALSRVLNLVLGKTVMADISSTKPVTETERTELLKQTTTALAQINKQTINPNNLTPAVKAEISRLMQQQNLIQSPELKWVNLVVNNRPLLTYSDRPLAAGQTVPVQLQGPDKLVLLDLPETDSNPANLTKISADALATGANIQSPAAKNIAALAELLKTAATDLTSKTAASTGETAISKQISTTSAATYSAKDLSLKFSIQSDNKNTNPNIAAAKTIVSENLRNLLPLKDTPNVLLSAVAKLQQMPAASRSQLISPTLEQALKSLAEQIRSPEQLSQPKVLAQALKSSGTFFEKKLSEFEQKLSETVQNNHAQNANTLVNKNALNNIYTQDLKGALLTLLNRATQDMTGDKKSLSSEQTQKLIQQIGSTPFFNPSLGAASTFANKGDVAQILSLFVQQLMLKPVKELSDKELRTQLLTLLQQHSVHSLAKIQLQQLHALNHELDTKDSATPNASWQMEIPVKHHNDVHPLHVRIDREWIDEQQESESGIEKSTNKIKQWSVTLTFDLPTLGEFVAQLAIINTQVSATLWAAQEKTFTQVRDQIEGLRKQLEGEGINVKYLQGMRGIPPQKPLALSYSLIDIST